MATESQAIYNGSENLTQQKKEIKVIQTFDQTMKRLIELKNNYEKIQSSRLEDKRKTTSEKNGCLDDVQKMRKLINSIFDKLETSLAEEATNIEQGLTKEIDMHLTIVDDAIHKINGQLKCLDHCKKSEDLDIMSLGIKKTVAVLQKCEEATSTIQQEIYPIQIKFKPNAAIPTIMRQINSLGSVEIRRNPSISISHGKDQTKTETTSNRPSGTDQTKAETSFCKPPETDKTDKTESSRSRLFGTDETEAETSSSKQSGTDKRKAELSTSIPAGRKRKYSEDIIPPGTPETHTSPSQYVSHETIQTVKDVSYSLPLGTVLTKTNLLPVQTRNDFSKSIPDQNNPANEKIDNVGRDISLNGISVGEKEHIDVGSTVVYDCTLVGNDHLVLSCGPGGLKLLDNNFKVQDQLFTASFGVATVDQKTVITIEWNSQQRLQCVSIFPKMAVIKTLEIDRRCCGISVFNREIYATCYDHHNDNAEVRVLNMDGQLLRRLGVSNGQNVLRGPSFIKVSPDGSKIYVSDWGTGKVTCLNQQGRVLYQYADTDLSGPSGMYVDDEGTVLVCGGLSHNVYMINPDGKKHKVLLSEKDDVKNPRCIWYRQKDGCLVVGHGIRFYDNNKSLLIFGTKMDKSI